MKQIRIYDMELLVISCGGTWGNMGHKRNRIKKITWIDLNNMKSLRKGERLETKTIGFYEN